MTTNTGDKMKYFGDYVETFLCEATVLKGSDFDGSKCVLSMRAEESIQELLINKLEADGGNFFKWNGELITIFGSHITSDHQNSKLKSFYALDLNTKASEIHSYFDEMIVNYEKIVSLNKSIKFGDVLTSFAVDDFFKNGAVRSIRTFLAEARLAFLHALADRDAFSICGEDLLDECVKNYRLSINWYKPILIKEQLNLRVLLTDYVNRFDVDAVNNQYHEMLAEIFTLNFCKKQDFKAFCKFVFCPLSFCNYSHDLKKYESKNNFNKYQDAISGAFAQQGMYSVAAEILGITFESLIDLEYGDSKKLDCGLELIRRKYNIQFKMPNKMAQQLQIFLLKYNRSGVERHAA